MLYSSKSSPKQPPPASAERETRNVSASVGDICTRADVVDDGQPYDEFDNSPQNMARRARCEREEQDRLEAYGRFEAAGEPWVRHAAMLAEWTEQYLVNRRDVWGRYRPLSARGDNGQDKALTAPPLRDRGEVLLAQEDLVAHYAGRNVGDLIGLHSTSEDGTCRWIAWDIDRHDDDPKPPDPEDNWQHARLLYDHLTGLGLKPLLTDSNGKGGYHVRVVLKAPIPVADVYKFAQGVATEVPTKIETFPKQGRLSGKQLGNWLRLPGRHHTREHYTGVWSGNRWLEGEEAIKHILATTGDDPHIVIEAAGKIGTAKVAHITGANKTAVVPNGELTKWFRDILARVPVEHFDDYGDWIRVGRAIHNELPGEDGLVLWTEASQRSDKYESGVCEEKWETFANSSSETPVTVGTLIHWIREVEPGYQPPPRPGTKATDDSVGNPNGVPSVLLPGLHVTISQSAEQLGKLLAKTGHYYSRGGAIHTVRRGDGGELILEAPTPAQMASRFEEVAALKKAAHSRGKVVTQDAICNESTAKLLVSSSAIIRVLPRIVLMSPCPVLIERDGKLIQVCGYDKGSGILAHGELAPDMPLANAVHGLKKMLADFDFATPGDYARGLIALVTPAGVFGDLLKGRAPMDLGEANDSQAGKGYRARLTAAIYRNAVKTVTQQKGGVGSLEEKFATVLISGANFVGFDNIRGNINSPMIESFLTEDVFQARRPYMPAVEIDARRIIVSMTSNSAELTPDLTNRSICTRIKKRPEDYAYRRFPKEDNADMLAHVRLHQPRYLGAVFAVWRAWFNAGKPMASSGGHDFRRWAGIMGWISENIFQAGDLLAGHREVQRRMATPALSWLRDVAIAIHGAGRFGTWLTTDDIVDIIAESPVQVPGLADGQNAFEHLARQGVYSAMGKRLAACFRDQNSRVCIVDLFRVERREQRDHGRGRDWSVKSYRFSNITDDSTLTDDASEQEQRRALMPGSPGEDEEVEEVEQVSDQGEQQ